MPSGMCSETWLNLLPLVVEVVAKQFDVPTVEISHNLNGLRIVVFLVRAPLAGVQVLYCLSHLELPRDVTEILIERLEVSDIV